MVPARRAFLRWLIDLTRGQPQPEWRVYLVDAARADLRRWRAIFPHWNGSVKFSLFVTEASGSWGCGAVWQFQLCQLQWCDRWASRTIAERASPCGAGSGTVGCREVGRSRVAALAQHNSCVCRGHGIVAGFLGHAPATHPSILRQTLRLFVAGATPPGNLQYAGRPNFA